MHSINWCFIKYIWGVLVRPVNPITSALTVLANQEWKYILSVHTHPHMCTCIFVYVSVLWCSCIHLGTCYSRCHWQSNCIPRSSNSISAAWFLINECLDNFVHKSTQIIYISVFFRQAQVTKLSDTEIVEMILFPALNEVYRVISEGVVMRPSDLDVASVLAMGFPSYRFAAGFFFLFSFL